MRELGNNKKKFFKPLKMSTKRPGDDENGGNGVTDTKKAKADVDAGILLFSGATDWDDVGRKTNQLPRSPNTIWQPVKLAALEDVQIEYVSSGPAAVHTFAITTEGKVYSWGRNEKGQLGLNDLKDRKCPTLVTALDGYRVVKATPGKNHSLFLTDKGQVLSCGENKQSQCGVKGSKMYKTPVLVTYDGPPAIRISAGQDFSALVDVQGNVWTWGSPEYGQCGNNTDGKFIEKAGREDFVYVEEPYRVCLYVEKDPKTKKSTPIPAVNIKEISCGHNHCVAIDDRYRAFSWGFGGYGRLGHSETGNEHVPRLIKFLDGPRRGIRQVMAGGKFNIAISEIPGTVYMWGQYTGAKEANMYPKPIADLSGWIVRSIGCGTKGWMIAADESVIGCAPSPCFGELAMGENKKSSAQPTEITKLDSVYVHSVGCGVSHSCFIVRNDTEADKKALEKFKVLDQSELDK